MNSAPGPQNTQRNNRKNSALISCGHLKMRSHLSAMVMQNRISTLDKPEHWEGSPGGQIRRDVLDFPGGPVGKNLPANAADVGWIPGPGRSHTRQLSPWATATETSHSRACAPQQEKPPQREACAPQLESSPCSMQPD